MWYTLLLIAFVKQDPLTCAAIKSLYSTVKLTSGEKGCCANTNGQFHTDTCVPSKSDVFGGLDPSVETALDTFLQNGALLRHLPTSAKNDKYTSLPFISLSVRRGADVF